MSLALAAPTTEQTIQIILIVLGLALAWTLIRFLLRLALKIFACGCAGILAIGLLLFLFRYLDIH
ncbi:MAG: hypothetical protein AB1345_03830 [Chloroflexota bacterium]